MKGIIYKHKDGGKTGVSFVLYIIKMLKKERKKEGSLIYFSLLLKFIHFKIL